MFVCPLTTVRVFSPPTGSDVPCTWPSPSSRTSAPVPCRMGSSTPIAGMDSTPMVPVASNRSRLWYSVSSLKSASRVPSARMISPICTCWTASRRLYSSAASSRAAGSVAVAADTWAACAVAVSLPSVTHWFNGGVQMMASPPRRSNTASSV